MELLPAFLKLAGRRVVVVGGGPVAASKLDVLVRAGADVTVVAPEVHPAIRDAGVALEERPFVAGDLDGAWFVVAAATPAVNAEVAREAGARQLFVNAVDDPPNASVYLGGVVRRGGVTVAISTSGEAPALVAVEVPLLYETGGERRFDAVVVVTAPAEVRAARARVEAAERERRLVPDDEKVRRADFSYVNTGTLAELDAWVAGVVQELTGERA